MLRRLGKQAPTVCKCAFVRPENRWRQRLLLSNPTTNGHVVDLNGGVASKRSFMSFVNSLFAGQKKDIEKADSVIVETAKDSTIILSEAISKDTHRIVQQKDNDLPQKPLASNQSSKQIFEVRKVAKLASGSVMATAGDCVLLVTAVSESAPRSSASDFLPLSVDYREKFYAAGSIPQTIRRREVDGGDDDILKSRVIDRVIRPLFPPAYCNETQIIATLHSYDENVDPLVVAVNATSAAICTSDIPWNGPVGCVRVAEINGELIVNPSLSLLNQSTLNLVYAGSKTRALMIEADCNESSEERVTEALKLAHDSILEVIDTQETLMKEHSKKKRSFNPSRVSEELMNEAMKVGFKSATQVFENGKSCTKDERKAGEAGFFRETTQLLTEKFPMESPTAINIAAHDVFQKAFRKKSLASSRYDGRSLRSVRSLEVQASVLPSVHGSSIFARGDTQTLCTVTLGSLDDAQIVRSLHGLKSKSAMLHYEFPPYCVNETGRVGGVNRRMIGHGALAEKAILPVLPSSEEFPYTIRMTSEVTSSDGSSSMATACGVTLALMDAGVPIKTPVAGISIGLVTEGDPFDGTKEIENYKLLTDILGSEDHYGDMDLKVAGTHTGITAIQLDVKLPGIPMDILGEGIKHAKKARLHVLKKMLASVKQRKEKKENAPHSAVMSIQQDQIGEVIGSGGSNLRDIEESTKTKIRVNGDIRQVHIFGPSKSAVDEAVERITGQLADLEVGRTYTGKVVEVMDFGMIVEVAKGKRGFVHISEIHEERVENVLDHFKVGDACDAVVLSVDRRGGSKMSVKASQPASIGFSSISSPSPPTFEVGNVYSGKVVEVLDFGVRVQVDDSDKHTGFIHISEYDHERIESLTDKVKVGENMEVVFLGQNRRGLQNGGGLFSRKALFHVETSERLTSAEIKQKVVANPFLNAINMHRRGGNNRLRSSSSHRGRK